MKKRNPLPMALKQLGVASDELTGSRRGKFSANLSAIRSCLFLLLLISGLALTACGQGGNDEATATAPVVVDAINNGEAEADGTREADPDLELEPTATGTSELPEVETAEIETPAVEEDGSEAVAVAETPVIASTEVPEPESETGAIPEDMVILTGVEEKTGVPMVFVSGGTFPMGTDVEGMLNECAAFRTGCKESWFTPSSPEHLVTLAPYYIDAFETTNGEFARFLNSLGTHEAVCFGQDCYDPNFSRLRPPGELEGEAVGYGSSENATMFPVMGATWFGAAAYCQWRGARLPTEAEWEMAAGWDPENESRTLYPWGDVFDGNIASFCDVNCQENHANSEFDDGWIIEAPVGNYEEGRSQVGVFDMGGNLWEWVADWFSGTYYAESPSENPRGPREGTERVVRGGSWFDSGNFTDTFVRFPIEPEGASNTIGFRCALDG